MKNKKDAIILIICTLLLLVSVSYSWMLGKEAQTVKSVQMNYSEDNSLTIASSNSIRLEVLYLNKATGQYVAWDPEDLSSLKPFTGLVPGDSVDFKLRFQNLTDVTQTVKLSVGGIKNTTEGVTFENSLVPQMFLNVSPGEGFKNTTNADVVIPEQIFHRLDEANFIDGVGALNLYPSLTLPPTGDPANGVYVELDCYFWLDHSAGGEYQNMTMDIEYFRVSL